jgi:Cu(I)/Ag(I) efflux system membrane fusion protein
MRQAIYASLLLVFAVVVGGVGYRLGSGLWPWHAAETGASAHDAPAHHDHNQAEDHSGHGAETAAAAATPKGERRILYYRNPMGLPDISPKPKKDQMGMDYIPVYAEESAEPETVVVIPFERIQRSGYRTDKAAKRVLSAPVRAPVALRADERRVKVVALRMESFVEKLFVDATGQTVREGQPLFRIHSPQLIEIQVDLLFSLRSRLSESERQVQGAVERLRNLAVPDAWVEQLQTTRRQSRTIDWPSPASGVVIEKNVLEGQRAAPGDELYRIADLSTLWAIADVAESDIGRIKVGDMARLSLMAYPGRPRETRVSFVYPDLKSETRTVQVRMEMPNADGTLRIGMYGEAAVSPAAETTAVLAVPVDAVIDSGQRQVAILALGEGRFEPKAVKLGRRGGGMVEIVEGLSEGDDVVTAANFLIDAESNLRAALRSLAAPEVKP